MTTASVPTSAAHPPASPAAAQRRRRLLIGGIVAAVALALVIAAIALFTGGGAPRLNDNAVVLGKFVGSSRFEQLPFEQQRQFYKVLDDRDQELDQAFRDKRLTESDYRAALEAAWLGKHLNRTEKYFALPPGQGRVDYLDKLVAKKERKSAKPANPNAPPNIDADETAAELKVEKWPSATRTQWDVFHTAYRKHRKAIEDAKKPQSRPTDAVRG